MPTPSRKLANVVVWLTLMAALTIRAQDSAGDEVVTMETFNVTAYHGKIPIIDGFTGKDYRGDNDVVFNFAQSFNKLLIGYHKKLVIDEIKHLQFRIHLGKEFEREMGELTATFGFGTFTLDDSTWLRRERAIISRLFKEPFFKIKALVAWDVDRLNKTAPNRPESKYAVDIRYNPETGQWERRITARWDVIFYLMIDAYQRWSEPFIEKIRGRLLVQKELRRRINGQTMLTQVIEELSGMPYAEFAYRARITQEARLADHKINRPVPHPPAAPNSEN